MSEKVCIICNKTFISNNWATKSCSEICRKKQNNIRRKNVNKLHEETFNCVFCNKEVTRYRKRNGFCSRSCASKKYIQDGTYDTWRYRIQEKKGIQKNCVICSKEFYAEPKDIVNKKICGEKSCKKAYMSKFMSINNPSKGKKENVGVREKVKKTLFEKYGVYNAFELAKHVSLSKPQKELTKFLVENTSHAVLSDFALYYEKKCYKVDILIKEKNLIIEFNGTYWHCDPRFYEGTYFNKKKQKKASQIWDEDKKRIINLKKLGYNVKIIWEFDFYQNKEVILKGLLNE